MSVELTLPRLVSPPRGTQGGDPLGAAIEITESLTVHFGPFLRDMNDDEFFEFCQLNRELRIERTSEGEIIIMAPTGGETGRINFDLNVYFGAWVKADGTGVGFDSSTGFMLPNGAKRSPDVAWVKRSRWEALTEEERKGFPPLCPDFVVEIRSESDEIGDLKGKMEEYIANGAQLGWLIDPLERKVYIYQPATDVLCLDNPKTISGDPVLPGFVLNLERLWW